jgi:hypothetical protein
MGVKWRKVTSDIELWEATGEKYVVLKFTMSKWRCINRTLNKGYQSPERQALDWRLQRARRKEERNKAGKGPFGGSRKIANAATRPNLFYNDVF